MASEIVWEISGTHHYAGTALHVWPGSFSRWVTEVNHGRWTCRAIGFPDRDSAKRACEELWRRLNGGVT